MSSKTLVIAASLLVVIVVAGLGFKMASANPLRESEDNIRLRILGKVPAGSSVQDVKNFIAAQGWKLSYNWEGTPTKLSETFYPGVKGQHVIGADLGHYLGIFGRVDLDAYWGFDAAGRLIDVHVRKGVNAL
jgi:hypothetical protein